MMLYYHCTSMGFGWVALIPEEHMGKKGYDDAMDCVCAQGGHEADGGKAALCLHIPGGEPL